MKTLENQYLAEYQDKLDAQQEYLDYCYGQFLEISRADVSEYYRLLEIVQRLTKEVNDSI